MLKKKTAEDAEETVGSARPKKERVTFHLPTDLTDRVRDVTYWTPGMTMAGFAEEALQEYLARCEKSNGGPFPPRKAELKGGRPMRK